jgi:hypothetical protein
VGRPLPLGRSPRIVKCVREQPSQSRRKSHFRSRPKVVVSLSRISVDAERSRDCGIHSKRMDVHVFVRHSFRCIMYVRHYASKQEWELYTGKVPPYQKALLLQIPPSYPCLNATRTCSTLSDAILFSFTPHQLPRNKKKKTWQFVTRKEEANNFSDKEKASLTVKRGTENMGKRRARTRVARTSCRHS